MCLSTKEFGSKEEIQYFTVLLCRTQGLEISEPYCDLMRQENVEDRRIPAENKKKRWSTLYSHNLGVLFLGVKGSFAAVIQNLLELYC